MQIDSNNIVPNAAEAGLNQRANNQPGAKVQPGEDDLKLRSDYHNVLRKAIESDFTGLESLEQVRVELESGALDDHAVIKATAKNIMLFGI